MIERSRHLKVKALCIAFLILIGLPGLASATTFSFGDIDPTDEIQSIIIVGEGTGVTYTAATGTTGTLVVDGWVSTINFVNKAPISIAPGVVTYSSQLSLTVGSFIGPAFNVAAVTATLMNGMTDDFSIIDLGTGLPVLGGNYDGPMDMTATVNTGVVRANFSADLGVGLSGDGDVLSAFGNQGLLEFQIALGQGASLCTTILTCPPPLTPGSPSLNSFSGPPNGSIAPVIPEPSTALLLGVGLAGMAIRTRRTLR